MEIGIKNSNVVKLRGILQTDFSFSHKIFGEKFYDAVVDVERLSGNVDSIPIMISSRLFDTGTCYKGASIFIIGELRSYNKQVLDKRRLKLCVFVKEVTFFEEGESLNEVMLAGYICKSPIYRKTPLGRCIADIFLATNHRNRSSYVPCVCWERNAQFVTRLKVGTYIQCLGRIQSREYRKQTDENTIQNRTAYEVSINEIRMCLVKEYEYGDMSICNKYAICEECPCYIFELRECVHPYTEIDGRK